MTIANSTAATVTTDDDSYARFVLAQLECAGLRARLLVADIASIDAALRGKFIDADGAIAWANEIGALGLIVAPSTILTST